MNWKSSIGNKLTFGLASALAFVGASSINDAAAQKKPVAQAEASTISASKLDKTTTAAVFAKYDMLDTAATKTAFIKYLKQTKTTEARMILQSILKAKTINALKLEKAVQPFVVGLTEDAVQLRLDVIMRDYYLNALSKTKLSAGKIESLMESRAKALDSAVFGKTISEGGSAKTIKKPVRKFTKLSRVRRRYRR